MTIFLILPRGYGFRRPRPGEVAATKGLNTLVIWEPPRRRGFRKYILAVDVSDGLGQDRSVIEVLRCGTIEEPAEQVAEYVTEDVMPAALAYTVQAVGQYYRDQDGVEALVAIECNNHGLSTQDTLHLHLGYSNFYIWEYYDERDPSRRQSRRIGWNTTPRTRPMLLDRFATAVTTLDPITNQADLVIHSPRLLEEMKDFQTESGLLWEAAAAKGAHDDCVMATAIGNYVAWRQQVGETEPLEERRRHRSEQIARQTEAAGRYIKPDWRNTPATTDEQAVYGVGRLDPQDETDLDTVLWDDRAGAF